MAELSGVLGCPDDFLHQEFRGECERLILDVNSITPKDWTDAFLFLKTTLICSFIFIVIVSFYIYSKLRNSIPFGSKCHCAL